MALFIALALSYLPDEYFWAHLEMTGQEESPEKKTCPKGKYWGQTTKMKMNGRQK